MDLHEPTPGLAGGPAAARDPSAGSGSPEPVSVPATAPAEPPAPGSATARTSRTGRNLPVAIAVGLGLGAFVPLTLFTVKSTFLLWMGLAVALAIWELDRALRPREVRLPLVPLYAGGTALWTLAYWLGYKSAFGALALTAIAIFGWRLHGPAAGYLRDVTAGMFTLAWLPLGGMFVALMLTEPDGDRRVFIFVVVTICSDIGGYFAGISFGKHLFAPQISPKKTWEGLAGSAFGCLVAGGALVPAMIHHGHWWQGLLLGAAVVTVAFLGDLAESMIKRDLGIKDMGSLLPGHGGVLDRIDAMLLSAPVTWVVLVAFFPR